MTGRPNMGDEAKTLVIGASGQVGGVLLEVLNQKTSLGTWRSIPLQNGVQFSLTDVLEDPGGTKAWMANLSLKWVVIAAAMSQVDACESQPGLARTINAECPAWLASTARSLGARTLFFSTEYVFDGETGPYDEEALTRPISVYGLSKLEGERAVLEADPNALIVRTTVVYGPERQGKNFAFQVIRHLIEGRRLRVPNDQVSTPTYNRDLANATVKLMEKEAEGIWHVVGSERMSRVEFARRIARALDLDESLLDSTSTSDLDQMAPRPLKAGLRNHKLTDFLKDFRPHSLEESMADWIANPGELMFPIAAAH